MSTVTSPPESKVPETVQGNGVAPVASHPETATSASAASIVASSVNPVTWVGPSFVTVTR